MMNRSSSPSLRKAGPSALTVLAAISLVLGGCVDDRQIGGEGGSGGMSSGTQGTTSTGTQGTTGTGTMDSCLSFPDDAPLGTATFTVKNNRAAPIYIRAPVCFSQFAIATSPGGAPQYADRGKADGTCENPLPPDPDCLDDTVFPIAAGGALELGWGGLLWANPTLPAGCPAPEDPIALSCYQGNAPMSGTLEVTVDLYETASCGAGMVDCYAPMGDLKVKKTFAYPADTKVQVDVN